MYISQYGIIHNLLPPNPYTLPVSVTWLKSERNEKILLVWRRNLNSVCRVRNRIPETESAANAVSEQNIAFCRNYVKTVTVHEGLAPRRTMCVERTTLAWKCEKNASLQSKCPHGFGSACCYFDHFSLTWPYFWSVVSLFQLHYS